MSLFVIKFKRLKKKTICKVEAFYLCLNLILKCPVVVGGCVRDAVKKNTKIVKWSLNMEGGKRIFIIKIIPEIGDTLVLVGGSCNKIPTN